MSTPLRFFQGLVRKALGLNDPANAPRGRYEAAFWNTNRTYLPGFVQGAREDIDSMSRQEMLRRVRYFEKNNVLAGKTLAILNVNVIGAGITPASAAKDTSWAAMANEWWASWALTADITGLLDAYSIQAVSYRAESVDGEALMVKTKSPVGRPAIELVEAHRFGTVGLDTKALERQGFHVYDGIIIDQWGRPMAFAYTDAWGGKVPTITPASMVVHLFDQKRAGQYRGISRFHAAILDLHDLDDLQKYEMRAAKDAAAISKIITTPAGATTQDGMGVGASLANANTTNPNGREAYYRQALGGETILAQVGDEYKQFMSERPSAATSGFWDKLAAKIAQGTGISEAALVDYKGNWGGATLRAAVQSDNRLYNLETIRISAAWQEIWEYAVGWAIQVGELPQNPDWKSVRWHPPRRTTVDIGNDSSAMLEELKAGLRTYRDVYGEIGEEWEECLEQRAKEEAFIEMLATKYNVPAARIASFAQERLAGLAPDAVGPQPGTNSPSAPQGKTK